jgi:phage repressor protein C with HTH and peptisase S24 domain
MLEDARAEVIEQTKKKALARLSKSKGNHNALKEAAEALKGQATVEELAEASGLSQSDAAAAIGGVAQFDADKWREGLKCSGKFAEVIVANDANYRQILLQYAGFIGKLRRNSRSGEIEALEGQNSLSVPMALLGAGEHYALEVSGDSMIEAGILDGDYALIRKANTARDGEIVVALVRGEEATLKYLRREGQQIRLDPANGSYEPQYYAPHEVEVQGKLAGLLRRYH